MRKLLWKAFLPIVVVSCVVGCVLLFAGCASAPTKFDQRFFDIQTNTLPRVVVVTNVVPSFATNMVTVWRTNVVSEHETEVVPVTNVTTLVSWRTNVAVITNLVEAYTYTANTNAAQLVATASRAASRRGLNVYGLLLLGAAYGIIKEGLTCKSFFNPYWTDTGF
jgi:hypothetical protein